MSDMIILNYILLIHALYLFINYTIYATHHIMHVIIYGTSKSLIRHKLMPT